MEVSVEFLGRTRILARGNEMSLPRQSISFLAYLVLFRNRDHPRDALIEQFWSGSEPSRAKSCLGSALSRLRKGLQVHGSNWLELSPRGEPRISSSAPISFDVVEFEASIATAVQRREAILESTVLDKLISGLARYRGDLLLGWYDDWILAERERLRLLCLRGYRRLMEHYCAVDDTDSAIDAGQLALCIEPLQERVQERVIELYMNSGQRAAAIRQYERLCLSLKTELGISPARKLTALVERMRSDEVM